MPAEEASEVRRRVELHRRFLKAAAMIGQLNLRRWWREKGRKEKAWEKP
ncbi:MAG: hypothetical protein ABSA59_10080 [Terriglobia bacterium]